MCALQSLVFVICHMAPVANIINLHRGWRYKMMQGQGQCNTTHHTHPTHKHHPLPLLYTHTYPSHFLCTQYPLPFPYTLHIQCPPAICMGRHTMNQYSSAVSTITHLGVMVPVLPHKLEGYSRSWTAAVQVPTGHWLMM